MANEFITPTELIIRLDLPADSQPTDRAAQAVAGASAAIREACGWHIYPVVTGLTYAATGTCTVVLPAPVAVLTSVTVDGVALGTDSYTLDAAAGLVMLRRPPVWRCGDVVVTYSAGYAVVPEAVRDVCLDEAVARYGNPVNAQNETIGDAALSYSIRPDLATDFRLRAYRHLTPVVA